MSRESARHPRARCGPLRSLHHRLGPSLPHRRTDRVEELAAWLLLSLGLLALFGAVAVGHSTYGAALERGGIGGAGPVAALLLADVPLDPAATRPGEAPSTRRVPVAWTSSDGVEHTDELVLSPPVHAGSEVAAWLDGHGRLVASPPEQPSEAAAFGVGAGLTVLALVWSLIVALWCGVRRAVERRNAAAWAREWARVEPQWSRGVR